MVAALELRNDRVHRRPARRIDQAQRAAAPRLLAAHPIQVCDAADQARWGACACRGCRNGPFAVVRGSAPRHSVGHFNRRNLVNRIRVNLGPVDAADGRHAATRTVPPGLARHGGLVRGSHQVVENILAPRAALGKLRVDYTGQRSNVRDARCGGFCVGTGCKQFELGQRRGQRGVEARRVDGWPCHHEVGRDGVGRGGANRNASDRLGIRVRGEGPRVFIGGNVGGPQGHRVNEPKARSGVGNEHALGVSVRRADGHKGRLVAVHCNCIGRAGRNVVKLSRSAHHASVASLIQHEPALAKGITRLNEHVEAVGLLERSPAVHRIACLVEARRTPMHKRRCNCKQKQCQCD